MITTNVITLLVTSQNTNEKFIVSTNKDSLTAMAGKMKDGYKIDKILEFDTAQNKFKKVRKGLVKVWTDHCIEFQIQAEKQRLF